MRYYKCEFCDKTFKNGANARKHKREVHPIELKQADKNEEEKKVVKLPKISELLIMLKDKA